MDLSNAFAKECPFCGLQPDLDDGDTLYPNGTGWYELVGGKFDGQRAYCRFTEVPKEQWVYSMNCNTCAGGCGAEISGHSAEEALEKWNRRH